MGRAFGGDVLRAAERLGGGGEHGTFFHHEAGLLQLTRMAGAFDPALTRDCAVVAALPIDAVVFRWREEREQPPAGFGAFFGSGGEHGGGVTAVEFNAIAGAPAGGTLAAEAAVGKKLQCAADGIGPAGAGGVVGEHGEEPEAAA